MEFKVGDEVVLNTARINGNVTIPIGTIGEVVGPRTELGNDVYYVIDFHGYSNKHIVNEKDLT